MSKKKPTKYSAYISVVSEDDKKKLQSFFYELDKRLFNSRHDKKLIKNDFERAIVQYNIIGIPLDKALELLDLTNLGGFYSRSSELWLPLDDVAKPYSQFVDKDVMPVFRMACELKERVYPEILQMALNFTIKRFPYFAMYLRKGLFWHYLDSTRGRFSIEKEGPLPVQRMHLSASGSKAFKVLYYENRISVEFFHAMTDGTGGKEFLKTLVLQYLRLLGKDIKKSPLVIEPNSMIDTEEYENSFLKIPPSNKPDGYISKKALQLSGNLTALKPCRVLHFKMPTDKLKEVAKKYGVNVTAYISSLIFLSCKNCIDDLTGDVGLFIPVNMRKCFPSNTLRNFSLYCKIARPIEQIKDLEELTKYIYSELKDKSCSEKMIKMMAGTAGMMKNLRFVPLIFKQPVTKILYRVLGDNVCTTTLSNIGFVDLPEDYSNEVESMNFVLGTTYINRVQTTLMSVNNCTTFSISKLTRDPSFEETFYRLLTEDGIECNLEGSENYAN